MCLDMHMFVQEIYTPMLVISSNTSDRLGRLPKRPLLVLNFILMATTAFNFCKIFLLNARK